MKSSLVEKGDVSVERRVVSGIMLTLLLIGTLTLASNIQPVKTNLITSIDSLRPNYYETSEFLIGSVAVGVIFPESNGNIDPSTEDWTSAEESLVISKITTALNWLAGYNPSAHVTFSLEVSHCVPTSYEAISRSLWDHGLWITETIEYLGYPSVLDYVNDLRNRLGTNWAFLIFVVDSSNDADGRFQEGVYAHGPVGGPYLLMTYDGPFKGGIYRMPFITAHEIGHTFYATDEYNDEKEYSGYLNISDHERAHCLMRYDIWKLCDATQEQIGWRDSNEDGILDILDTHPNTTLTPYLPDPTSNNILTYAGFVTEIPYLNRNPYTYTWPEHHMTFFPIPRTRRNITINTITNVEYRIDDGPWMNATATDDVFDEPQENFTFTTPPLSEGVHKIEVRGINSVRNVEISYASDIITISMPTVTAAIDIHAHVLNLRSRGRWITAYIELPEGHNVVDIDASTILLNDAVPAELYPTENGDYDEDSVADRMVKFDRAEVMALLSVGEVTLTITGEVSDTSFEGSDTIKVIDGVGANHRCAYLPL